MKRSCYCYQSELSWYVFFIFSIKSIDIAKNVLYENSVWRLTQLLCSRDNTSSLLSLPNTNFDCEITYRLEDTFTTPIKYFHNRFDVVGLIR